MTASAETCVESVKHAPSDRKRWKQAEQEPFMNLRGKTQRQLRRRGMSESCGARGIQVCGALVRNKGVNLSPGRKMEAVKFMGLLVYLKLR